MTRPLRPLASDPTESVSALINATVNEETFVQCPQCGGEGYIYNAGCGGGCEYCPPFPKCHACDGHGRRRMDDEDEPTTTVERPQREGDEP